MMITIYVYAKHLFLNFNTRLYNQNMYKFCCGLIYRFETNKTDVICGKYSEYFIIFYPFLHYLILNLKTDDF